MTVTGFINKLFRFKPFLFIINGLLWCMFHSLPLVIGLAMQWFFDRAAAAGMQRLFVACCAAARHGSCQNYESRNHAHRLL